MVTRQMVYYAASTAKISCRCHDGEWRLTPMELSGQKAEDVAYYTDDNDDAYMTIAAMRNTQNELNRRSAQLKG